MSSQRSELLDRARRMRREPTEPELRLWRHLSNSQLGGFKFRRQATIAPFIIDFLCPAKALIVETDGDTHEEEYDLRRDTVLNQRGFSIVRFTNSEVMSNIKGVLAVILDALSALPGRVDWRRRGPTPTPLLKGRV